MEPALFVALGFGFVLGFFAHIAKEFIKEKPPTIEDLLDHSHETEVNSSVTCDYIFTQTNLLSLEDYFTITTNITNEEVLFMEACDLIMFNDNGHVVFIKDVSNLAKFYSEKEQKQRKW